MAKNFSGGLSSLLQTTQEESKGKEHKAQVKRGRPTTSTREVTKTSQEGTREGETRATFIVKESTLETLKALAFFERKQIKATVQEALEAYIATRTPAKLREAQNTYEENKQ